MNKKRVAILTLFHGNSNYGANLQAYALRQVIRLLGCKADVIDCAFMPEFSIQEFKWWYILFPEGTLRGFAVHMLKQAVICLRHPARWADLRVECQWKRGMKKMNHFRKRHIEPVMVEREELSSFLEDYDVLVTGSDQVWNPTYCSQEYFLPFEKKERVKASYGASIGRTILSDKESNIFLKNLPDFDFISVRENEAKNLLESLLNVPVEVVLDPTLLLTAADWDKLAEPVKTPAKYILFAAYGHTKSHRDFAQKIADSLELPLVVLTANRGEIEANRGVGEMQIADASPGQFLTLVRGAELVITDSYHFTVFSIIYHRKFLVLKRDPDSAVVSMNSRFYTLLGELGLSGGVIDLDTSPASLVDIVFLKGLTEEYYGIVEKKLIALREKSISFLKLMLGETKA